MQCSNFSFRGLFLSQNIQKNCQNFDKKLVCIYPTISPNAKHCLNLNLNLKIFKCVCTLPIVQSIQVSFIVKIKLYPLSLFMNHSVPLKKRFEKDIKKYQIVQVNFGSHYFGNSVPLIMIIFRQSFCSSDRRLSTIKSAL